MLSTRTQKLTFVAGVILYSHYGINIAGLEAELQERVTSLEHSLEKHEKQKKKLLFDFDAFKGECADHEAEVKADSDKRIASLSRELEHTQQDFASKMKSFETLIGAVEQERNEAIEDLKKVHQKELENLLNSHNSKSSDALNELDALKIKFSVELQQAQLKYDDLKTSKDTMENDYEEKLKKSKALYEKELELLRENQNQNLNEKQNFLQEKLDKLTKDFQFQEAQYRQRIDSLVNEISVSEETIAKLKADLECLDMKHSNVVEQKDSLTAQVNSIMMFKYFPYSLCVLFFYFGTQEYSPVMTIK